MAVTAVRRRSAALGRASRAPSLPRSQAPRGSQRTIVALDGLRGLAIAAVLWCHLDDLTFLSSTSRAPSPAVLSPVAPSFWLYAAAQNAGTFGVTLFFVLSGFLLFLPYAHALLATGSSERRWPRAAAFYLRRCRRILPAYGPVLAAILIATAAIAGARHVASGVTWASVLAGTTLLYNHHYDTFNLIAYNNPVLGIWTSPLWSLAVEWQFYLLLPVLAWGLDRLTHGRPRQIVLALLGLIVLGLAIRALAAWAHYTMGLAHPADASGLLGGACMVLYGVRGTYIEVFALGMLGSLVYVRGIESGMDGGHERWTTAQRMRLATWLLLAATCMAIVVGAWAIAAGRFSDPIGFYFPSATRHGWLATSYLIVGDFSLGVSALALLLAVLCLPVSRSLSLRHLFEARPLVWLGLISYSVYLWHVPIMKILFLSVPLGNAISPGGYVRIAAVLAVMLALSSCLYFLIERPFLPRRRAPTAPARSALA